jgi:hypothetical protein
MSAFIAAFRNHYERSMHKPLPDSFCTPDGYDYRNPQIDTFCKQVNQNDAQLGFRDMYNIERGKTNNNTGLQATVVTLHGKVHSNLMTEDGRCLPTETGIRKIEDLARRRSFFLTDLFTCYRHQNTGRDFSCTYTKGPISPKAFLEMLEKARPYPVGGE